MIRSLLGVGFAVAALGALLLFLPSADASEVGFSPQAGFIKEGQAIAITVMPDSTTNPSEVFSSGDRVVVTDPANCKYSVLATPGSAPFTASYPNAFDAEPGNAASCADDAHTAVASTYQVDFIANPLPSQSPYMANATGTFDVLLTDRSGYTRSSVVQVAAIGFAPNAVVNVQFDRPAGAGPSQPFNVQAATADATGRVTSSFVLPKGLEGDADLGTWTVRVVPTGASPKLEDRQTIDVVPTDLGVTWTVTTVPASVARTSQVIIGAKIMYNGSLQNPEPLPLTSADVTGGLVDLVLEKNGQSIQTPTLSYDSATKSWRAVFQMNKDAPAGGGYVLRVAASRDDKYGNPIEAAVTPSFAVTDVTIAPSYTVLRPVIERANPDKGLSVNVRLLYPSGVPVSVEDMRSATNPDGVLQAALFRDGTQVPGSLFLGVFTGNGVWEFKDQILPRDTPLGSVTFRLLPTSANPAASPPNVVRTDLASGPATVFATQPRLQVTLLKDNVPVTGVLWGQEVTVRVRALYPNQALLEHDDAVDGGRALLRVVPGDASRVFDRDFVYDGANGWWQASYLTKPTDAVGLWTLNVLFTDNWDNDNLTVRSLRVGLQVDTQLSASTLARTGNVTLTSTMSRPGTAETLAGNMNVTLLDPLGNRVGAVQALQPITGGKYQAKLAFPSDALLGTYRVLVRGTSGADAGVDVQTLQLGSSALQVKALNLTASSVQRLGTVGAEVRLAYPNGALLDASQATPSLRFQPSTGPAIDVPLKFDAARKSWVGNHTPAIDAPLGDGRFVLSAKDKSNNTLTDFLSSAVRVDAAAIKVGSLSTLRTQYLRGETVTVRASFAYGDGQVPTGLRVPVQLRAGNTTVATIELAYAAEQGAWQGSVALPLDAPLGTPAQPWRAVVAKDSARDGNGNKGPPSTDASSAFDVQRAQLGITILNQTQTAAGAVRISFALTAPDGTHVMVPVDGLRALVVRNGQVGNESLLLVAADDHYLVTLPAKGVLGGQYAVRIEGADTIGNLVTGLDSAAFTLQADSAKESPFPGLALAVATLVGAAVVQRIVRRRD